MSTLNGIINFSGSEQAVGLDKIRIGDITVSVAMDLISDNTVRADVRLIGLTVNPESGIEKNEDGSVTFYGGLPTDEGGDGGGGSSN